MLPPYFFDDALFGRRVFGLVAVLAVIGVVAVSVLSTKAAKDLSTPASKPENAAYIPHDVHLPLTPSPSLSTPRDLPARSLPDPEPT